MRRLGSTPLCTECGSPRAWEGGPLCPECLRGKENREHQMVMSRLHGELAVLQTDRPSDGSYRHACAAMEEDVAAALEDWPMGNGILGPRY